MVVVGARADRMMAIESGGIDIIGAARPSIADPFLPEKIADGRGHEIRRCIGSNECLASLAGRQIRCSQNATAGEEFRRGWHPERYERSDRAEADILVVGAGPAGMECAMVLGRRGYRSIRLVDAADNLGGHLRWLSALPGLDEWRHVISYRAAQLAGLPNVEVELGQRLRRDDVLRQGPSIVVLATGSRWATDGLNGFSRDTIPGADARYPYVLTPEQLVSGQKAPPGSRVIVYDCDGYLVGAGAAQWLAERGNEVTLVTPLIEVAPHCDLTREGAQLRRQLHDGGVDLIRRATATRITEDRATFTGEFGESLTLEMDAVVLVTQRVSDEALYLELQRSPQALAESGVGAVHRVGDCVAPQYLADAIFEGHRLARELDAAEPGVPLAYARERVLPAHVS